MATITLRTATIDDLAILEKWEKEPHVMASGIEDDWHWDVELQRNPVWREQLIAEVDGKPHGRPIGMVQIIDPLLEDTHYWGDCEPNLRAIDIWIGERDALGKGYGTVMMRLAMERCFANPNVTAIIIDPLESNVRAQRFYERLGFRFVEKRRFDEDDCVVMRITREDFLGTVPL
ncbi:MAG: GNAT family N-acetyltransferase [Ignavibacteria bacterium]|nr:GNAT family N-acetyltransferase [Ignavibacteria bacterium]